MQPCVSSRSLARARSPVGVLVPEKLVDVLPRVSHVVPLQPLRDVLHQLVTLRHDVPLGKRKLLQLSVSTWTKKAKNKKRHG